MVSHEIYNMNQEQVLFKSLFGSRLYGTDTPESDTDYKEVYMPSVKRLLRGLAIKNSAESTGDDFSTNGADDEDYERIPVQVFTRDYLAGQSYAYELAHYALHDGVEVDPAFRKLCAELVVRYSTSNVKAMTGYAMSQAQKYGVKGTRLNSIMLFQNALLYHHTDDKMKLGDCLELCEELWALAAKDENIGFEWYRGPTSRTPEQVKDPAFTVLGKVNGLEVTFEEALLRCEKQAAKYGARAYAARAASGSDWKAISHALRVIDQAIDILNGKMLEFPRPLASFYRDVKAGKYKWEYVSSVITERLETLAEAQERTELQSHSPQLVESFYEWHDDWLDELYFPSIESFSDLV
ncbi:nucleotidyltransferase [Vibrio phage D484]